jgi:hypothetical protein
MPQVIRENTGGSQIAFSMKIIGLIIGLSRRRGKLRSTKTVSEL